MTNDEKYEKFEKWMLGRLIENGYDFHTASYMLNDKGMDGLYNSSYLRGCREGWDARDALGNPPMLRALKKAFAVNADRLSITEMHFIQDIIAEAEERISKQS